MDTQDTDTLAKAVVDVCRQHAERVSEPEVMARVLLIVAGGIIGGNCATAEQASDWCLDGLEALQDGVRQGLVRQNLAGAGRA